ncbi:MAG TPA: hypothetical protein VFG84_01200 [Gemmatimonadaceae bacterium]|nr:hypothetical protein [Gemmatimonadaceae bacterium]
MDNLEMCSRFLRELDEPIRWKWAIIAAHQALYAFAVMAVQGTDACSVLERPEDPSSRLISFWEALKRAKDPKYLWSGTTPLVTTPEEDRALERVVKEFRNGFEHFAPAGWSIEVSGMPALLGRVLRVIHGVSIGAQSGHVYDADEAVRLRNALGAAAVELGMELPARGGLGT